VSREGSVLDFSKKSLGHEGAHPERCPNFGCVLAEAGWEIYPGGKVHCLGCGTTFEYGR